MLIMRWVARATLAVGCAFAAHCSRDVSSGRGSGDPRGNAGTGTSSLGTGGTQQSSGFGNAGSSSGAAGSVAPARDAGSGAMKGCVGSSKMAPPPASPKADLVWVVDASGSMLDEQMKIGSNLAKFADDITAANLDVHIVMLTESAAIPVICPETSPDPLAGTKLAGDPRYKFIQTHVDSHNLLDVAVDSFDQYRDFLRADAVTHFVTVTDDESTYRGLATPQDRASMFKTDMTALLGRPFIQHTISSEGPSACSDPNCMPDTSTGICAFVMLGCGAAAPGSTYYEVAAETQGLTASICQSDWSTIFTPLTAAVIQSAPLPCNYTIPPPPAGEALDPGKVNVAWIAPSASSEEGFPKTKDESSCGDKRAWYYDVPGQPTQVVLCPATCMRVAAGGTLNITFGCATAVVE